MAQLTLQGVSVRKAIAVFAVLTSLLLLLPFSSAQTITSTLTGTVADSSGAVIPGAQVVLTDQATRTATNTKSNGTGQFTFPVLQPGTYDLTVTAAGFSTVTQKGITLATKEARAVNLTLKVGAAAETVEVSAGSEPIPLTTGASATTLNNTIVDQAPIVGRDAAELIRLMPGMAINSGLNNTQWNSAVTQINNGPIGNFSANGTQPNGGLQLIMNGSVITDPGNQGTQVANVNQDMTQEVTFQNGSFDAEHAHGPVTFESVGKRGSRDYHGTAYVYTRNGSLNANDSFKNAKEVAKPIDHYWYTGGNFGGPISFPGFNKNKDKAFFFVGIEHKKQNPAGALHQYFTPTQSMINGDFTQSVMAPFTNFYGSGTIPCADTTAWNFGNYCHDAVQNGLVTLYGANGSPIPGVAFLASPSSYTVTGAKISPAAIDPNGQILMKLLGTAPGLQAVNPLKTGGFNSQFIDRPPFDGNELNFKVDYNLGSKNKIFGTFTRQTEQDINNLGLWWWTPNSVPYPSSMPANQMSRTWSVGVTTTFSNSMVNEASFGYAYFINPVALGNPKAADPATYGYNVKTPFAQPVPQIPSIVSWCCTPGGGGNSNSATGSAGFGPGSFGANPAWVGNFTGKDSKTPDFSEKFTWVKGKHSMKFGFFWAQYANIQVENACCNGGTVGNWDFDPWASNSTNNIYADMLVGHPAGYSMSSQNYTDDVRYNEFAWFAQDQWRVLPRLTLNLGLRFDREGNWFPNNENQGIMVWDSALYNAKSADTLTGFTWHGKDASIPLSGWPSHSPFPDPRVGAAFDVFGNGRTVVRGGLGIYRYQVSSNNATANGMLDAPLGLKSFASSCTFNKLSDLAACGAAAGSSRTGTSPAGMLKGDDKSPYTQTWNVMIDQRAPWNSTFEIQYSGNRTRDMLLDSNSTGLKGLNNINYIPVGGLFKPDPVTGITYYCQGTASATCVTGAPSSDVLQHFRPYDFTNLYIFRHGAYSNYNAMVMQWMKHTGKAVFNLNYTWSKALGIRGGDNNNGSGSGANVDAFTLANNYGTLAFDRRHIFNATYVFTLPSPIHNVELLKQVVNGWTVTGVTQFQTGPPLQPLTAGNLNAGFPGGSDSNAILGTDGLKLEPYLTCNPASGLSGGQYFNPSCFAAPNKRGVNGPLVWPNITGPGFTTSDVGIYKTFKMTERHKVEFRFMAFNWMNHPNPQFGLGNDVNLTFSQPGGGNTNTDTTGKPKFKVGNRMLEFALKYSF